MMKAKGGVLGTKLRPFLEKLSQEDSRSDATEHVLKILVVHEQRLTTETTPEDFDKKHEDEAGCDLAKEISSVLMELNRLLNTWLMFLSTRCRATSTPRRDVWSRKPCSPRISEEEEERKKKI
ncbi:hypothetical protein F7725_013741, partial [Dissostichus mawsoni]